MDDFTYNFNIESINKLGEKISIGIKQKLVDHSLGFTSPHADLVKMNEIFTASFTDAPTVEQVLSLSFSYYFLQQKNKQIYKISKLVRLPRIAFSDIMNCYQ